MWLPEYLSLLHGVERRQGRPRAVRRVLPVAAPVRGRDRRRSHRAPLDRWQLLEAVILGSRRYSGEVPR